MNGRSAGLIASHVAIVLLFVVAYFYYLRQEIISLFYSYATVSNKSSYVPVIEWGIVCVVTYVIYRDIRRHARKSLTQDLRTATWATHVQRIAASKKEVMEASKLIDSFVENSSSGEILTFLASALLKNKVGTHDITEALRDIARYSERSPTFAKRWAWRRSKQAGIELRTKIIQSALDRASMLSGLVIKEKNVRAISSQR